MEQFEIVQEHIREQKAIHLTIELELSDALGHVLQEDIIADEPMPPFNKSAMDGYACRKEDLSDELEILETIAAGVLPNHTIGNKQSSRIMTGAAVPEGADCVFMIEDAIVSKDQTVHCTNPKSKLNICYLGEDYKKGDVLLSKGTILQAAHLPVIAGTGLSKVRVSQMPKLALVVTGSELCEFSEKPKEGMIRNTNAIQLISLLKKMNMEVSYEGIVADNYDTLRSVFQGLTKENEIVLFTGGAAAGDFDLVPDVIRDEGYTLRWTRTGMKPGNPMSFALKEDSYVFGLSGNPVSSYVQFEYLVKPLIYKLLGANFRPGRMKGQLAQGYSRKNPSRMGIVPVRINQEGLIETLPFNGSAHINALAQADAFMEVPPGLKEIKKGEMIYVRPI